MITSKKSRHKPAFAEGGTLIIATMFRTDMTTYSAAPITAWLGGMLGVAFVGLNTYAVPRLGAGKTTCFVVGAQMLASVTIDTLSHPFSNATLAALGGSALVIAGVWMTAFEGEK